MAISFLVIDLYLVPFNSSLFDLNVILLAISNPLSFYLLAHRVFSPCLLSYFIVFKVINDLSFIKVNPFYFESICFPNLSCYPMIVCSNKYFIQPILYLNQLFQLAAFIQLPSYLTLTTEIYMNLKHFQMVFQFNELVYLDSIHLSCTMEICFH